MRWIDRGPEPDGVQGYARQFTQGWVEYFRDRVEERPNDSYWREFRQLLSTRSGNICWYRERLSSVGLQMVQLDFQLPQMQRREQEGQMAGRWLRGAECRR